MSSPLHNSAPLPNARLPKEIKDVYEEAQKVAVYSPRSAAALLRLAIRDLIIQMGGKGKNLDFDVADLIVTRGIPQEIASGLQYVKLIGDNAEIPGKICDEDNDNASVIVKLFSLLNLLANY